MGEYVVLDLEMCKVKGVKKADGSRFGSEIIQIGAVILDESYKIVGRFNSYVKPCYGKIDTFISRLTGIGYDNVAKAPELKNVLDEFVNWIGNRDVQLVTWSGSDEHQLRSEMKMKNMVDNRVETLLENVLDSQKMFSELMDMDRGYKLEEALILADIDTVGRAHDGYADAENTAQLFAKMMKEPEFCFNSYYSKARSNKEEHIGTSMGDLFANLGFSFG